MQLLDDYKNVSLSHATLRSEDLVPAFMSFLEEHSEECNVSDRVKAIRDDLNATEEEPEETRGESVSYILNEDIFDLLNEIAPEGSYFGAHPGDGSDFGFWEYFDI